jgi:hypothetical protein
MLINPVSALAEAGVELSPRVASHVLHSMQLGPAARNRRAELERSIKAALGEAPKPLDQKWLAHALFELLELRPKRTEGHEPVYEPPLNAERVEHLQKRRPPIRPAPDVGRPLGGMTVSVAPWRPAFRRMDLEAPVPELKEAPGPPASLELTELWFYKDDHQVAHDLLELGVILRGAFPVHSADGFREIKAGRRANAFLAWITDVRFKTP